MALYFPEVVPMRPKQRGWGATQEGLGQRDRSPKTRLSVQSFGFRPNNLDNFGALTLERASGLLAQHIDLPGHLRHLQLTGDWYLVWSHLKTMSDRENNFPSASDVCLHPQPPRCKAVHTAKIHTSYPQSPRILVCPKEGQKSVPS